MPRVLKHLRRAFSRRKEQEGSEECGPLQEPHDRSAAPERPERFGPSADIRFPHAIVKANFVPRQEDELAAQECDLVALLRRVDDNWYQACTMDKTKVGYIPRNYLKVLIDIAAPPDPNLSEGVPERAPTSTLSGSYQNITKLGGEYKPRPPPQTPILGHKPKKLRRPGDYFFTALETFNPESEDDIGAKAGEVMLWIDDEAHLGQPIPEAWISCMNLAGKSGTFPGNFARPLNNPSEIETLLQKAPHAIATKTNYYPTLGYVRIEEGEAMYIDRLEDEFIYGRTASGNIGKLSLANCQVIVPP
ncbi:hypothetical protein Aperf_G00000033890 [Anoplocephala perfoliata]